MAGVLSKEKRRDYLWIAAGTFLAALSANLCFTPAKMVPGGFTGLAIIIKYITAPLIPGGLPTWASNTLLNIPLILAAIRIRGWKFMRRTFITSVVFSLWLLILPEYPVLGDDLFLVTVIGGASMGAGLGMVFLGKATTGGTDTLGALLTRAFPHISTARLMQFMDVLVIALSVWIFGISISTYAAISVVLTSRVADRITYGSRNAYSAHIISDRYREISDAVLEELNRGVTVLQGQGMYTGEERRVLLCAVSRKQAVLLREIVAETDPKAFMILTDAREIRGEGFLTYNREEI